MTQGQLDCTTCEEMLLGAEDLRAASQDVAVAHHLSRCRQCADLFESLAEVKVHLDQYRIPEPGEHLVEAVLAQAATLLRESPVRATIAAPSRATLFRVVMAGLAALPFVVLINTVLGWALYECAVYVLPRTIALYCLGVFVGWVSLTVSLSYASLPFLSMLAKTYPVRVWRR